MEEVEENTVLQTVLDIANGPCPEGDIAPPIIVEEESSVSPSPVIVENPIEQESCQTQNESVECTEEPAEEPPSDSPEPCTDKSETPSTDNNSEHVAMDKSNMVTSFYTPMTQSTKEENSELLEEQLLSIRLEDEQRDGIPYGKLIVLFHQYIPLKNFMAYGLSHPSAFTGHQLISTLQKCISTAMNTTVEWTRKDLVELAEKLANEYWLFLPCGLQQKKSRGVDLEMRDTDSVLTATSSSCQQHRKSRVKVNDDDISLYRLTKDALCQQDISNDTFEDFTAFLRDAEYGVPLKDGSKMLMVKKISKADGIFSRRTLIAWLQLHLKVTLMSEIEKIVEYLEMRNVLSKIPMKRLYRFRQFA